MFSSPVLAAVPDVAEDERVGCYHVPARFEERWFANFDPSVGKAAAGALEAVRRLVAKDIQAVLLSGPVGTGKTHLAAAACNELVWPLHEEVTKLEIAQERIKSERAGLHKGQWPSPEERLTAIARYDALGVEEYGVGQMLERAERRLDRQCPRWINVPLLLGNLKRQMRSDKRPQEGEVAAVLDSVGLLVLDDLGSERPTDYTAATLFELVGVQYDSGFPLLATSNLTAEQLVDAGYERIVSRFAENGCLIEMASAKDYRQRTRVSLS